MKKPGFLKSKAEKELEARIAVKKAINDLKKNERALEKKKNEMLKHAQEAKKQGITQQYNMAVNGLKMIMSYQKRCQAMILQIQMTESVRDLTSMSAQFVKLMGNVGKEITSVTKNASFAKNQLEFEKGMMAAEDAMGQLEDFLEDSGMAFETQDEEEVNTEIEKLIDATGAAKEDPVDLEIDRRLAELEKSKAGIKEE